MFFGGFRFRWWNACGVAICPCGVRCRKSRWSRYGLYMFLIVFCFFCMVTVSVDSLIGLFLKCSHTIVRILWLVWFRFLWSMFSRSSVLLVVCALTVLLVWILV